MEVAITVKYLCWDIVVKDMMMDLLRRHFLQSDCYYVILYHGLAKHHQAEACQRCDMEALD